MNRNSRRRVVLVVDDSESILRLVAGLLRTEGFDVVSASSARDAIAWCHAYGSPDLLLSDVQMPDVDGPTLHQLLEEKFPGIPTLFMSGGCSQDASELGQPLLPKPFKSDELKSMINLVLYQQSLTKQA